MMLKVNKVTEHGRQPVPLAQSLVLVPQVRATSKTLKCPTQRLRWKKKNEVSGGRKDEQSGSSKVLFQSFQGLKLFVSSWQTLRESYFSHPCTQDLYNRTQQTELHSEYQPWHLKEGTQPSKLQMEGLEALFPTAFSDLYYLCSSQYTLFPFFHKRSPEGLEKEPWNAVLQIGRKVLGKTLTLDDIHEDLS